MQFRYYLDSVEELISYYEDISEPCLYVKMTPKLFNKWSTWARAHKPKEDSAIREFGTTIGPDFMRTDFTDLEDFYQYYSELIENE